MIEKMKAVSDVRGWRAVTYEEFEFVEQSLINRHKLVYKAMGDFVGQIHAISIVSKTSSQWEESNEYPSSPECAK